MSDTSTGQEKSGTSRRGFLKYTVAGVAVAGAAVAGVAAVGGSAYYKYSYLPSNAPVKYSVSYWTGGTTDIIGTQMTKLAESGKYGTIEWFPNPNAPAQQTEFAAGKEDLALIDLSVMASAATRGSPIQVVYQSTPATSTIVTKPNSPYKSVADLRNLKVGVANQPSVTFTIAVANLQDKGVQINYKDFNFTVSAPPTLAQAVLNGELAACELFEPLVSQYIVPGKLTALTTANAEWQNRTGLPIILTGLVAQKSFAAQNPSAATNFIRLYIDTMTYLVNNQDIMASWAKTKYNITDQAVLNSLVSNITKQFSNAPPYLYWDEKTISSLNQYFQLLVKSGAISNVPPPDFFTMAYKPKGT